MIHYQHNFLPAHHAVVVGRRRTRRSKKHAICKLGWCRRSGAWVDQAWTVEVPRLSTRSAGGDLSSLTKWKRNWWTQRIESVDEKMGFCKVARALIHSMPYPSQSPNASNSNAPQRRDASLIAFGPHNSLDLVSISSTHPLYISSRRCGCSCPCAPTP